MVGGMLETLRAALFPCVLFPPCLSSLRECISRRTFSKLKGATHMSNINFHRRHMTAVPTDLLLDPMISIEAKAFAGILQAIPTGNHDLQELAVLICIYGPTTISVRS